MENCEKKNINIAHKKVDIPTEKMLLDVCLLELQKTFVHIVTFLLTLLFDMHAIATEIAC